MSEVTEIDIKIMNQQTDVTLAQWYCELNKWNWPAKLPDEDLSHKDKKYDIYGRRGSLMSFIHNKVGNRLISWEWNKERMAPEEFNDFYDGTYEDDKEARKRYEERLENRYN